MKSVEQTVFEMLTENTGVHMLDSGGGNGRHWQKNSVKTIDDFRNEPEEKYFFSKSDGCVYRTLSTFHYLCGLDTDDICQAFNKINSNVDNWECPYFFGVSSETSEWLHDNFDVEHGDTFNTYNWDSDLSQILQYNTLKINGESYYCMQVHNGADVRGGYTDARLFKAKEFQGGIHEYLYEFKHPSEIENDIAEGYATEFFDWVTEEPLSLSDVLIGLK
jgi:hypothetical protein